MAVNLHDYDSNGLARGYEAAKWALFDKAGNRVSEWYSYIEEWGEGYYKVEQGAKKNIMRPDCTLVLEKWHNDVHRVQHGFFLFGNTIRKSKSNPKTRYIRGLAHVSGNIIFPMIFDHAYFTDKGNCIYAELGTTPYILTLEGGVYDPARGHLPKKVEVDLTAFFEKFIGWTLPGLQFFYRDTDAPVIAESTYQVGGIIRAGQFIDVTTELQKPAHRTRFLIASAHTAMLCAIGDLCERNPNIKRWNLCTLHFNSYFRVMDVYAREGVTQVFLLHIPAATAFLPWKDATAMNFIIAGIRQMSSLIEKARHCLNETMLMEVHPRSLDQGFCERMYHPVGLDEEFYPVPLTAQEEPEEGPMAAMSSMIHDLADDADIDGFTNVVDNFPYQGVKGSVCKGCMYADGIQGNGEGCGRLSVKSFRERYLKGRCEYRKVDLTTPSLFERTDMYEKEMEKDRAEKACGSYALDQLQKFVNEQLDGDIGNLKRFDLASLEDDGETNKGTSLNSIVSKSILLLAFSDAYEGLTFEDIDKKKYVADTVNITNTIFGFNYEDHYKALETFDAPKGLRERAIRFGRMVHTIGNVMVLPSGLHDMRDTKPLGRGYCDAFLSEFYKMMTYAKKCNMKLFDALGLKRKEAEAFRNEDNYRRIIRALMLEDFHDGEGRPRQVFQGLFSWEPGIDRDTYLHAATEFLDFCEPFIEKRADRIIEKLRNIIGDN